MDATELEREEIKVLSDEGYSFEINYNKAFKYKEKIFGLIPRVKTKINKVHEVLRIEPLRLSTMDRIAKYQIELYFDESKLTDENDFFIESNSLVAFNIHNAVSIIAIAVMGVEYNHKRFKELKEVLLEALTPKELYTITSQIFALSDHANFINSTRLMIARNPIKPNEVE